MRKTREFRFHYIHSNPLISVTFMSSVTSLLDTIMGNEIHIHADATARYNVLQTVSFLNHHLTMLNVLFTIVSLPRNHACVRSSELFSPGKCAVSKVPFLGGKKMFESAPKSGHLIHRHFLLAFRIGVVVPLAVWTGAGVIEFVHKFFIKALCSDPRSRDRIVTTSKSFCLCNRRSACTRYTSWYC
jgi:hypothetical protein